MEGRTAPCPCPHPCNHVATTSPLMTHGESFRFRRGDELWHQGDPASWVAVVCTGAWKLSTEWNGGHAAVLDLISRGEVAGEEAAIAGSTRPATCTALVSGKGVRMSRERLRALVAEKPELAHHLLAQACSRLETCAMRVEEMMDGSVKYRLARVLLRIGDELGLPDARGVFVPLRLARGDLADMVGCRVETVIRTMTRWQREGVVETKREGIVIRDPERLRAVPREP